MQGILVNLVQLGFLGFAVAIMFLAFRLLQDLVRGQGQNPQTLKLKIISVGLFLGLSGVVLGLGIWYSLKDPNRPINIVIDLSPNEEAMKGKFMVISGPNKHSFSDLTELSIRNEARLTFDINTIVKELNELNNKVKAEAALASGLKEQHDTLFSSVVTHPDQSEITNSDEQGI